MISIQYFAIIYIAFENLALGLNASTPQLQLLCIPDQSIDRHIPGHFSLYVRYTSKRLGIVLFTIASADWLSAAT